jgi:hypothetical protein
MDPLVLTSFEIAVTVRGCRRRADFLKALRAAQTIRNSAMAMAFRPRGSWASSRSELGRPGSLPSP